VGYFGFTFGWPPIGHGTECPTPQLGQVAMNTPSGTPFGELRSSTSNCLPQFLQVRSMCIERVDSRVVSLVDGPMPRLNRRVHCDFS
jgi:hypothetical protein